MLGNWRELGGNVEPTQQNNVNTDDYIIPQYPLPPRPAASPPSTMPFAVIETEHTNAFTPPSETVNRFKAPGSYKGDKKPDGDGDGSKGLNQTARMGDIAYDEPPTTRNMMPLTALPPGTDAPNELRKDSVNPYCNYCIAYMVSLNKENGDPKCENLLRIDNTIDAT